MATQLFLVSTVADTHLGTDNTALNTTNIGWDARALATARGSGVANQATAAVAGPTNGVEVNPAFRLEWISPPVSADVTISGTITCNVWASESAMTSNVAINVLIEVIRANATATRNSNTLEQIVKTARTTEVAVTTRAVNNFTATPTSTAVNRGDRLRVRVFADDSIDGNMASGGTFSVSWNGTTGAADGDTYVTFTENFSFESAPGTFTQSAHSLGALVGFDATSERQAQSFTAAGSGTLTEVKAWLQKTGTPTDDYVLEIQGDSAGSPSGSVVGTVATVAGGTLTTTSTQYTYGSLSIALTAGTTYWLVFRRSGANSSSNYFWVAYDSVSGPTMKTYNSTGGAWNAVSGSVIAITLTFPVSTLYLTDTASDVATASTDLKAWTTRGGGVVTSVTNTAAGWTAPIQATGTAGGTVLDWFTPQLTAFTLTGMAVGNIRALESNALANASLRCEIARVNSDGTSPTVWSSWCCAPTGTDNGELTTSEVARTINLSGDDLAFTDGQRIRIRLYNDDISSAAMGASQTVTRYYSGTSAAASGDSYVTLAQSVSEYSSTPAASYLLPNRNLVITRR